MSNLEIVQKMAIPSQKLDLIITKKHAKFFVNNNQDLLNIYLLLSFGKTPLLGRYEYFLKELPNSSTP